MRNFIYAYLECWNEYCDFRDSKQLFRVTNQSLWVPKTTFWVFAWLLLDLKEMLNKMKTNFKCKAKDKAASSKVSQCSGYPLCNVFRVLWSFSWMLSWLLKHDKERPDDSHTNGNRYRPVDGSEAKSSRVTNSETTLLVFQNNHFMPMPKHSFCDTETIVWELWIGSFGIVNLLFRSKCSGNCSEMAFFRISESEPAVA